MKLLEKSWKCYGSPSIVLEMRHKSVNLQVAVTVKIAVEVTGILSKTGGGVCASSLLASDGRLPVSVFVLQERETTFHITEGSASSA